METTPSWIKQKLPLSASVFKGKDTKTRNVPHCQHFSSRTGASEREREREREREKRRIKPDPENNGQGSERGPSVFNEGGLHSLRHRRGWADRPVGAWDPDEVSGRKPDPGPTEVHHRGGESDGPIRFPSVPGPHGQAHEGRALRSPTPRRLQGPRQGLYGLRLRFGAPPHPHQHWGEARTLRVRRVDPGGRGRVGW